MPPLRAGVSLAAYTTLKVGGAARYFVRVVTIEELKAAVRFAKENALPFFILGGGSNVLVSDDGFPGVVIVMAITGVSSKVVGDRVFVSARAGVVFDDLVADTVKRGYWGLENLSHIPGTVGATPIQNVGAYGVEVSDCIVEVETLHIPTATIQHFTKAECGFGYRTSFFKTAKGNEYVVTSVTFALAVSPQPCLHYADVAKQFDGAVPMDPQMIRDTIIAIRANKFPDWHTVGTAGSFFKNPIIQRRKAEQLLKQYPELPVYDVDTMHVKCSLGYILDRVCGLRGYRSGLVRLYEKQALVLVAEAGATALQIENFSNMITKKVFTATEIKIEREVSTMSETIFKF